MRPYFILVGICFLAPAVGLAQVPPTQQAAPKTPADDKAKKADDKPASLEQLIAEALKRNPKIRLAEISVQQAHAQLEVTRSKLVADITILYGEIESAQAGFQEATGRHERTKRMFELKALSREELDGAALIVAKMKAELAVKKATMPLLLGTQIAGMVRLYEAQLLFSYKPKALDSIIEKAGYAARGVSSDEEFLRRVMLDVHNRLPTPEEMKDFLKMPEKERRALWIDLLEKKAQVIVGLDVIAREIAVLALAEIGSPLTDKLRKALDSPISLRGGDTNAADLIDSLRDKLKGVNLHVRVKSMKKEQVDLQLAEPIPLGAVLQFIEDELGVVFVLRDYGVVVTAADERLPPGAIRVIDFWKHGKTETKQDTKEKK